MEQKVLEVGGREMYGWRMLYLPAPLAAIGRFTAILHLAAQLVFVSHFPASSTLPTTLCSI